ncbi:MAG TPA: hypothetical protein VF062_13420 [Candidatus Limnocylindrales bacterium]
MKAHRTDSISLAFGLIFILIAGGYLATSYLDLDLPSVGWFIAGGLILLGVVGAITALIPSRKPAPQPVDEAETEIVEEGEEADAEQAR